MAYIRCTKKSGEATTDITPSNLVPATLTQNTPVKPTANGYAIASYNSVTPSNSSPVALTSGDIDKMGGNGYAIESYDDVTPSSTPVGVGSDGIVKFNSAGYITESVPSGTKYITQNGQSDVTNYATVDVNVSEIPSTTLSPSNSFPDEIENGMAYQAMGNGYAIASYSSVTPQPVPRSVSSGNIVKFEDSGIILDEYPIPNMQDKTVTATTSRQVVEPDSGYDGLFAVAILPQVHTGTYYPNPDTAQNDMDDIHNYRYVDTSGMVRPSSITPSNSNPASLTSGSAVTPTANGYAIASYDTVDPSSTPTSVSADDIVKFDGSGKIVDDLTSITPSSTPTSVSNGDNIHIGGSGVIVDSMPTIIDIEPSNSSPVLLTANTPVNPTLNGYAINSFFSKTPSNSTPVSLAGGSIYKINGGGYAIETYSSKTPSDSSPASVSSGAIIKASASGYLYATQQPKVARGTFTTSGSSVTNFTVNVGFQPDTIIIFFNGSGGSMSGDAASNGAVRYIYDKDTNATYGFRGYRSTSSSMTVNMAEVEATGDTRVSSITSTGFVWRNAADSKWNGTHTYIAIKW